MKVIYSPSTAGKRLHALHSDVSFRVHWLGVTIHAGFPSVLGFCRDWLPALIPQVGLIELGKGGMGYKQCDEGLAEFRIFSEMQQHNEADEGGLHCHVQLSGASCDAVDWATLQQFFTAIRESGYRFNVTRLDFAFDGCPFTPYDLRDCIEAGAFRSHVLIDSDKSFIVQESPRAKRDDGKVGTITIYFGAPSSDRRLRCYNRRGFTRAELQCRREWAHLIGSHIFEGEDADKGALQALGHLRDFADFNFPGWRTFVSVNPRAHVKLKQPALVVSSGRSLDWIRSQVAPTLKALNLRMPGVVGAIVSGTNPNKKLLHLLPDPYASVESVPGEYLFGLWWRAAELARERGVKLGTIIPGELERPQGDE